MNSLYSSKLKPIGLSSTLNGSLTHTSYDNTNWSFGKWGLTELRRSSTVNTFHYPTSKKTPAFVNTTTYLTRRFFLSTGKRSRSWWSIQVFHNSNFHFKAQMLWLATNTVNCFPWSNRFTSFIFEKQNCKLIILLINVNPINLIVKNFKRSS